MKDMPSRYDTIEIDGQKLKHLRKRQRKLTQEQLASLAPGVSRGYISTIELQPTSRVSRVAAESLAAALDVMVEDLQSETGTGKPELEQTVIPTSSEPQEVAQRKRSFRFGSGMDVAPLSRTDVLKDLLRQIEELRKTVEMLLRAEETHQ